MVFSLARNPNNCCCCCFERRAFSRIRKSNDLVKSFDENFNRKALVSTALRESSLSFNEVVELAFDDDDDDQMMVLLEIEVDLQFFFFSAGSRLITSSMNNNKRSDFKVAVVGCGISGAVCAWHLARDGGGGGVSSVVTVFDSGRGPGGRMSQRREIIEDENHHHQQQLLFFDHGAPYFTVSTGGVMADLVHQWEAKGLVAEWKDKFGSYDCATHNFTNDHIIHHNKENSTPIYVGIPGMNSICNGLCHEPGIDAKFGVTVGKIEWLEDEKLWLLIDVDGKTLGHFDGLVASDKNIVSPKSIIGRPPPLDMAISPTLALKMQNVPVLPCYALMLAFQEPLPSIPLRGISFKNSDVLSWAFCDSSKPGRSASSECWVLYSTTEYAKTIITEAGHVNPSSSFFGTKASFELLSKVAADLFGEFQKTELNIPKPLFMKAHGWGSAFPAVAIAGEDKCLWDSSKRLAICGDFCVSPNVEGAILSGIAAASKFQVC